MLSETGVEWLRLAQKNRWNLNRDLLEALLTAIAGFVGGFVSTLASIGSAVTLPALEFLGLPEHVTTGSHVSMASRSCFQRGRAGQSRRVDVGE
jgi:hypothetical protein